MEIALYQPDIPQNTGTILRLAACLGVRVHVIEPAGFDLSDRALRRAGLDYLPHVDLCRHSGWDAFLGWRARETASRLVLATTHAATPHHSFDYHSGDVLLFGRESSGVPNAVHEAADARIRVPMRPGLRSLNLAISCAMVLDSALTHTAGWPQDEVSA
jgi:tRNA (cytidine/uridine-2'-O-)-methyltransferase